MKVQILQDSSGNNTGVFIPINEWEIILKDYPQIMDNDNSIPEWEKKIVMSRVEEVKKDKNILQPIGSFFDDIQA